MIGTAAVMHLHRRGGFMRGTQQPKSLPATGGAMSRQMIVMCLLHMRDLCLCRALVRCAAGRRFLGRGPGCDSALTVESVVRTSDIPDNRPVLLDIVHVAGVDVADHGVVLENAFSPTSTGEA